jgi:hypothetical protein
MAHRGIRGAHYPTKRIVRTSDIRQEQSSQIL